MLPGGQERLLDGVLGVLGRAEDAVAVQLQLTPVSLDQLGEGIRVAGPRPGDQFSVDENPSLRVAAALSACPATCIDGAPPRNRAPLPTLPAVRRLPHRQAASGEPDK